VWALGVVVGAERIEVVLEFLDGGALSGGKVFLQGLPESFDLALGCGFVWAAVLLGDAV
jgi:hypothetical protein